MKFKTLGAMALSACMSLNAGPSPAQIEQEVFDVLQTNCSFTGCHTQFVPEMGSHINYYIFIEKDKDRKMPKFRDELPQKDLNVIRNWIDAGSPQWELVDQLDSDQVLEATKDYLEGIDPDDPYRKPQYTRFFTVSKSSKSDFIKLSRLLNRLSWQRSIANPERVNEMVFAINILNYWSGTSRWNRIEDEYRYDGSYDSNPIYEDIQELTNTKDGYPIIDIDWFLENASKPPLYHDLLRLPDYEYGDEKLLEWISPPKNVFAGGGFRYRAANSLHERTKQNLSGILDGNSDVAILNRVLERKTFTNKFNKPGVYWRSYDFNNSDGQGNIKEYPELFQHAGGEMIFTLPNGLHAYFITDNNGNGKRLNEAPTDIVLDARKNQIINGASCMGCHSGGIIKFKNELPDIGPYLSQDEIDFFIQEDNSKYWEAMNQIVYPEQSYAAPQQPIFVTNTRLGNNYPNPFNSETWIPFKLDQATEVTVEIYNVYGQLVRKLDLGYRSSGVYMSRSRAAHWDGTNEYGERVASGVYVYRLKTENFSATRKMVITK